MAAYGVCVAGQRADGPYGELLGPQHGMQTVAVQCKFIASKSRGLRL